MDPVSTALIAGLAAGVSGGLSEAGKRLIVDAYRALKMALQEKYGVDSDLVDAVAQLEKKPTSEARQALVKEEVQDAGADKDEALLAKAQELLDQLNQQPAGQQRVQMVARGSNIAQASHGGTASVNVNQPPDKE